MHNITVYFSKHYSKSTFPCFEHLDASMRINGVSVIRKALFKGIFFNYHLVFELHSASDAIYKLFNTQSNFLYFFLVIFRVVAWL